MTDSPSTDTPAEVPSPGQAPLPDDLPPVQPPSAGFILQLFVVPAIIVGAVVLVWFLFGKISSGGQDWRNLISEVQSGNEHRSWRSATELAQMLRADIELKERGQKLSANPLIATELAKLMTAQLKTASTGEDEAGMRQAFLARTLGWLDSVEMVVPVLIDAMQPERPAIVRLDAMRSIAIIASRLQEQNQKADWSVAVERILEYSRDTDPLVRQVSAFTLGLLPGESVDQRLKVMTEDADENTRMNAALGLARRGSSDGLPILLAQLQTGMTATDPAGMPGPSPEERVNQARAADIMKLTSLRNALIALRDIKDALNPEQREEALRLCQPVLDECPDMKIRIEAKTTIRTLKPDTAAE